MTDDRASKGPGVRRVESVERAMQLLELFLHADAETGISVTEVAGQLGIGKSTVSRLLATMAVSGMVIADESRRYRVGPLAFEVGNKFGGAALARSTRQILGELADQTNSTAALGTLQGHQVLYLSVALGPDRLRVVASPGDVLPSHATSMGKAILASLAPGILDDLVASMMSGGKLPTSGPKAIDDVGELHRDLALTRSRGYAMANEEGTRGVISLAVRVDGPNGYPMALSIAFPVGQFRRADHAELVRTLKDASVAMTTRLATGVRR